jgi:hypothetical protein
VNSITSSSQYAVYTQADQMRRDLSHAQILAESWGVSLRLTASSTGYTFTCRTNLGASPCSSLGAQPVDPASGNSSSNLFGATFTDGVIMSASTGCATLDFDSLGRPTSGTAYLTSACTYTLSGNGTTSTVTVNPVSGLATTS